MEYSSGNPYWFNTHYLARKIQGNNITETAKKQQNPTGSLPYS